MKKQNLDKYLRQRLHLNPYVCNIYGMMEEVANYFNKQIESKVSEKWKSHTPLR